MTKQAMMFTGVARYEFLMQVRRPVLWITFAVFVALALVLLNQGPDSLSNVFPYLLHHATPMQVLAYWSFSLNTLLPICAGALLADRLVRDRRIRVSEILTTLPPTQEVWLAGKFVGTLLATTLPMLFVYLGGVLYLFTLSHNALLFPLALVPFTAIVLPGLLFVTAFSLALPMVLPVPLYIFGFVGYWYWNSLYFHADLPNLGRTLLAPVGVFIWKGLFGEVTLDPSFPTHPDYLPASAAQGIASMVLLVAVALLVMVTLDRFLKWQQAHQ